MHIWQQTNPSRSSYRNTPGGNITVCLSPDQMYSYERRPLKNNLVQSKCLWKENNKDEIEKRNPTASETYIRLLGGILRPSLNQVTCGWGKQRMWGAGITAPSPWDTAWARSPSSKLPISIDKHKTNGKSEQITQYMCVKLLYSAYVSI